MIARIWIAYRVEIVKALRQKQTYLGPFLVLLAIASGPLVHSMARDGVSDYAFIAYVTPLALNFLGFFLLLIFSASLLSPEMADGSIRAVLTRPIPRRDYVLAKLALGCTYALVLLVITGLGSWSVAGLFGELSGVHYGGELVHTRAQMRDAYLIGAALAMLPLFASAAYGLLISAFTRSPAAAIALALGGWILADLLKHPLGLERYMFTTYLDAPWAVFAQRCDAVDSGWLPMAGWCAATSITVFLACSALAVWRMERRDLT